MFSIIDKFCLIFPLLMYVIFGIKMWTVSTRPQNGTFCEETRHITSTRRIYNIKIRPRMPAESDKQRFPMLFNGWGVFAPV